MIRKPDNNDYSDDRIENARLTKLSDANFEKFVHEHNVVKYLGIERCACKLFGKNHTKKCETVPSYDHGRLFKTRESRVFTYQPYYTDFDGTILVCHDDTPLAEFVLEVKQYAESRGLESSVSFASFYFPTRTLLVVLKRPCISISGE